MPTTIGDPFAKDPLVRPPVARPLARLVLAGVLGCAASGAQAAGPGRVYPMGSQVGYAQFGAGPTLQVNCVTYPLGPGLRVQTVGRHLLLRNQLAGLQGRAVFLRDASGNVYRVWMLGPAQGVPGVSVAPNRCLFGQY